MNKLKGIVKQLFIPSEKNNYKARAIHHDFLTFYVIIALFLSFASKNIISNSHNVLGFATDVTVEKLYDLTNQERQKNGLSSLDYNKKLASAADKKAHDMFQKNYWAHYAPDGTTPWSFILASDYKYEYAGENLAKNFLFSSGVVNAWMNSESHRENLLRKDYTDVGFAVKNGVLNGEETTLVVQMFGKPLSKENSLVVAQKTPIKVSKDLSGVSKPKEMVLSGSVNKSSFNIFGYSVSLIFIFFLFLGVVLLTDYYFAVKLNVFRLSGKNIAHLFFITFIVLGLFFITKGVIL